MSAPNTKIPVSFFWLNILCLAVLLVATTGCGGGKKKAAAKKEYGKPTWQKVDPSKFAKLSDYETTLEGGKIVVFDPEGWERSMPGRAPKGFKSVIRFTNGRTTILLTKSRDVREMPDLDESNIEDLAKGFQEKFKSAVKMIKLGNIVGVYFAKAAKDAERLSKPLERRIVATSIGGELYTYELVADKGSINNEMLNTLFAVISKTKIEGMETEDEEETASVATTIASEPTEAAVATTTTTPTDQPAAPETGTEEPAGAKPAETVKAEESKPAEIAATPEPVETKPETKQPESKSEPKKEAKKPEKKPAAKKGNTKDILNELDALLNL